MKDSDQYVSNCIDYRPAKAPRDKTPGLLKPIDPPLRGWRRLAIDFNKMPKDRKGFDNLFVMIDRLTKGS